MAQSVHTKCSFFKLFISQRNVPGPILQSICKKIFWIKKINLDDGSRLLPPTMATKPEHVAVKDSPSELFP